MIVDFRLLTRDDPFDLGYKYWSRIYEYTYVKRILTELGADRTSSLHNTCWGFEGVHVDFKEYLDKTYNDVLHSDIKPSNLRNTMVHDITKPYTLRKFDFVINVSTVEEVKHSHVEVIKNLLDQTREGGYVIITFDYGKASNTLDLPDVEKMLGVKLQTSENDISGLNSEIPENRNKLLKCGVIVLKNDYK